MVAELSLNIFRGRRVGRRQHLLASAVAAIPFVASPAWAQEQGLTLPDTGDAEVQPLSGGAADGLDTVDEFGNEVVLLDEIVVRGELLERSLQDTTTSAVVETGEALEQRGDRDVYDLIERAPNVVQTGGDEGVAIRGISQLGTGRGSSSPLVSTQVDGIALPDVTALTRGQYPTWDVEQIEVLRGPQSTQQGRNALGGAVVIRTRDPVYEDEYRFRLGYGSRDYSQTAFTLNKVLIEDRAAFRFSAETAQDDSWVDNPTLGRDDFGESDLESWRAKLRLNPTDDLELVFSYAEQNTFTGENRIDDSLFPGQRVNESDVATGTSLDTELAGLRASYDFSPNFKLETETSYYSDNLDQLLDQDRGSSADNGFIIGDGDAEVFEQDIRFLFEGNGFSGVAGLFYSDVDFRRTSLARLRNDGVPLPPGITLPTGIDVLFDGGSSTQSENYAIFGEVELDADRFLPGLSFTLGARYDQEDVTVNTFSTVTTDPAIPLPPGLLPAPVDETYSSDFDAFLPKLGATYEWREGLKTSLTFQRGYRAGGATRNTFTGTVSQFDPEYTDNIELAFRGSFWDGQLNTSANIFYTRWTDQQVVSQLSANPLDTATQNAGKSELYGAEFSVDYEVTPSLGVYASAGFLQAEFEDFQFDGSTNLAGNTLPNSPEATATIGMNYDFANGFTLGVDASFTGSAYTNAQNTLKNDSFVLLNAQLNYENDDFLAGIFVRNLLDEDYATARFLNNGGTATVAKSGEPLTVGAFVQYSF